MSDRLIKGAMFFFFGSKQNKGNILIEEKAVERLLGLLMIDENLGCDVLLGRL